MKKQERNFFRRVVSETYHVKNTVKTRVFPNSLRNLQWVLFLFTYKRPAISLNLCGPRVQSHHSSVSVSTLLRRISRTLNLVNPRSWRPSVEPGCLLTQIGLQSMVSFLLTLLLINYSLFVSQPPRLGLWEQYPVLDITLVHQVPV